MSTKIFYNDNRIIIDGHADTPQECQAITAMCDEMANSEKFKTIVYEQGHAVFERIGGGEKAMFLAGLLTEDDVNRLIERRIETLSRELEGIYLTQTDAVSIYASKTLLNDAINELKSTIGSVDHVTQGSVAQQLSTLNRTVEILQSEVNMGFETIAENIEALEDKASKPIPYTADELIAKLESI